MSTSHSFIKADSRNLPEVDILMILEYSLASEKYSIEEIRAFKNFARMQNDYVGDAIGFVKLKRNDTECIVKAKVLPEVKIEDGKKYFAVTVKIHEADNTIIDAACDCSDLAGGCKHTLMFLNWLQKKASIPERAPVQCYWHKPIYGMSLLAADIFKTKKNPNKSRPPPNNPEVLRKFIEECKRRNITNSLILSYDPPV